LLCINNFFLFSVILTIDDEVQYWKTIAESNETSKKNKEIASSFYDLFEDISEEIRYSKKQNLVKLASIDLLSLF
jgi:hypothetical protein